MDEIIIKGLKLYAYHGVNPEEKEDGQNFILDIVMSVDLSKPCMSDNIDDSVSYAKVIKTVSRVFCAGKYDLLEKASQVTADAVMNEYPQVKGVTVELKKPEAPMKADFDYVSVKIARSRT